MSGEANSPGLLESEDRVVAIDERGGGPRLLIRRVGTTQDEVLELPMEHLDDGSWQPAIAGGADPAVVPAFDAGDGYVPLGASGDWVLDGRWQTPDSDLRFRMERVRRIELL